MQVGIDSFAAALEENSRAVNPVDRLRQLVEKTEHTDEVGWRGLSRDGLPAREAAHARSIAFRIPQGLMQGGTAFLVQPISGIRGKSTSR